MAENLSPFVRNKYGSEETIFPGKVQAGSTQAIKRGEICCYNKTAGYWTPISAVADGELYLLAIANEEQKSTDLERFMEFIAPKPGDEFEYEIAASRQVAQGEGFTLTASNSQKLTYSGTAFPVFVACGNDNYPETGTTLTYKTKAVVEMNEKCSFWQVLQGMLQRRKMETITANRTLTYEDSGKIFFIATDALVITLPATKKGIEYTFVNSGADTNNIITISPNSADGIAYVTMVDDKDLINTKASAIKGDTVSLVGDGDAGWWVTAIKGTWAKQG